MAEKITSPRGTDDWLPERAYARRGVENNARRVLENFGYGELILPTFEHTELFSRGVGDTTDIVNKEMYTFTDRGGRSVTLRPEGTAGAVRASLQNGLFAGAMPVRLYYIINCFRYEKPQAGRLREFNQIGAELYGAPTPDADAEMIMLGDALIRGAGVKCELEINSIGCPQCRGEYRRALKEFFEKKKDVLCETCIERLEKNPLRILDCKSPVCHEAAAGAPEILEYLCDDCAQHFEGVKALLSAAGVAYRINPRIVRGLDYYTRTVFEFTNAGAGAQGTVCGGGRYDLLAEELGGPHTPCVGFAMGIERLMAVMLAEGVSFDEPGRPDIYIAPLSHADEAALLCAKLREEGIRAEYDIMGRGLKSQMKYADKRKARFTLVLGDDEAASGEAKLRRMSDGEEFAVKIHDIAGIRRIVTGG